LSLLNKIGKLVFEKVVLVITALVGPAADGLSEP
jgi:hypothetical protein